MTRRTERVNGLLRRELSEILAQVMRDPRLPKLLSLTRVEVTGDLRQAQVFVSVMGGAEEKKSTLKTLQAAAGFLHRELKPRLALRYVPTLSFHLDESIEEGARVLQLMERLDSSSERRQ
ncbi:MAG: 30S ribosome-binding factor RbfA [Chloroflexi bacterium]|nr:30S ribosome-binding factor RbfA [Chloroflexota bacterium]